MVPNWPGEQPQRKLADREGFQACAGIQRCTAVVQKRLDSWASAERSLGRESVNHSCLGGRGGFELSVLDRTKIAGCGSVDEQAGVAN